MRRYLRLTRGCLILATIVGFGACGSDSPTDSGGSDLASIAGTWTLQTVNGGALPVQLVEDGIPFTLHSGRLVLSSNGSCTNTFVTTPQGQAQKTETLDCTFTLSGSAFSYTEASIVYNGTLSGNTLTVTNDGNQLVYTR